MPKNRMINTKFWSDGWIVNLDPLERYLFLYFLTNEHTNICGIYELPIRIIARESGIDDDMIVKMLKKMSDKIIHIDGWVAIKNFAKHQILTGNVKKGIEDGLKCVPSKIMAKITDIFNQISMVNDQAHYLNPNPNLNLNLNLKCNGDKSPEHSHLVELIDYFSSKVENLKGYKPEIEWGKSLRLLKPKFKKHGDEKCRAIIDFFVASKKFDELGGTISICFSEHTINAFLAKGKQEAWKY